jgi:hypothetical protein
MKILIRATNWVGDAIMALPAIRAIRNRPDANISILARSYVADIYRDQDVADDLIITIIAANMPESPVANALRPNYALESLTLPSLCKTPSTLLGSHGAQASRNASVMLAMPEAFC